MKQTMTRDGFIHNLQGERSDKNTHNFLILGHAIFDLHDAVNELLERTKDLYHPTVVPFSKGKVGVKMTPTDDHETHVKIATEQDKDEGVESF